MAHQLTLPRGLSPACERETRGAQYHPSGLFSGRKGAVCFMALWAAAHGLLREGRPGEARDRRVCWHMEGVPDLTIGAEALRVLFAQGLVRDGPARVGGVRTEITPEGVAMYRQAATPRDPALYNPLGTPKPRRPHLKHKHF